MDIENAATRVCHRMPDGREIDLPVLTMGQIADFSAWWQDKVADRLQQRMTAQGMTQGQQMVVIADYYSCPPSHSTITRAMMAPGGIDRALGMSIKAGGLGVDPGATGTPDERAVLVARLLQLIPATEAGTAPDPCKGAGDTENRSIPTGDESMPS